MPSSLNKLILASRSPRRLELLRSLGLEFTVSPSHVDEITDPEQSPEQNATKIARDKAHWVARQNPGCYVLGADTMVVLDQEIIGQPLQLLLIVAKAVQITLDCWASVHAHSTLKAACQSAGLIL